MLFRSSAQACVIGAPLSERRGIGQESPHGGQRDIPGARREIGAQQAELGLAFHIMRQHEIENLRRALVQRAGKGLGHPLGLHTQIGVGGFF